MQHEWLVVCRGACDGHVQLGFVGHVWQLQHGLGMLLAAGDCVPCTLCHAFSF